MSGCTLATLAARNAAESPELESTDLVSTDLRCMARMGSEIAAGHSLFEFDGVLSCRTLSEACLPCAIAVTNVFGINREL